LPWNVERDEAFEKALKDLRKRFPNAERDVIGVFNEGHPSRTDALPKYGRKLWKGRVACSDARRSASNGFRVIYYWDEASPTWCCLGTFYFKGDYEDLPASEIRKLIVSLEARFKRMKAVEAEKKSQSGDVQPQPPDTPENKPG